MFRKLARVKGVAVVLANENYTSAKCNCGEWFPEMLEHTHRVTLHGAPRRASAASQPGDGSCSSSSSRKDPRYTVVCRVDGTFMRLKGSWTENWREEVLEKAEKQSRLKLRGVIYDKKRDVDVLSMVKPKLDKDNRNNENVTLHDSESKLSVVMRVKKDHWKTKRCPKKDGDKCNNGRPMDRDFCSCDSILEAWMKWIDDGTRSRGFYASSVRWKSCLGYRVDMWAVDDREAFKYWKDVRALQRKKKKVKDCKKALGRAEAAVVAAAEKQKRQVAGKARS